MGSRPTGLLHKIRFGEDFALDPRSCELRRAGHALKLEPLPMDLLLLLIEHRDRLVTREEIVQRLWGNGVFVDTENGINTAVRKVRQTLDDDPEHPRFIQTVPGRGYRFIAPIIEDTPLLEPPSPAAPPLPMGPSLPGRTRPGSRWLLPAAVAAALLILASAYFLFFRTARVLPASPGRMMLAVLPFDNLTGDASQEYLSDGVTEEIITRLGSFDPQRFGVIARTSVMGYKGTRKQIVQIGRELGVQYVLEGSVRRDQDRVRISVQLIQVRDQTHLWSKEYDYELRDSLTVESEIAQTVADEIRPAVAASEKTPGVVRRSSLSPHASQAYDQYLEGRYFWNQRTPEGFQKAIGYFQKAIDADPSFASAYSGLADSYAMVSGYGLGTPDEIMPKARAAALQALALDDTLAEAHTSLAIVAEYDWDWKTAEEEYPRAIQLNPSYATAHQWYAECLAFQGRFDEALAESERARQLDPLSLIIATDNAVALYFARQYDRSIARFRAIREMAPGFPRTSLVIGDYVQLGRFQEALDEAEKWRRKNEQDPWVWAWEAYVYGRAGQSANARKALERLTAAARNWPGDSTQMFVLAYAGMNDREQAIQYLQKAYQEHSNALTALKVDPVYDPLRPDPRFQDLLRRVGLSQ